MLQLLFTFLIYINLLINTDFCVIFFFEYIIIVIDFFGIGFFFSSLFCKPEKQPTPCVVVNSLSSVPEECGVTETSLPIWADGFHGQEWVFLVCCSQQPDSCSPGTGLLCSADLAACGPQNIHTNWNKLVVFFQRWMVWAVMHSLVWSSERTVKSFPVSFPTWGSCVEERPRYLVRFEEWPHWFVWDSAGWDKWHLPHSDVKPQYQTGHHLQFLFLVTSPISAKSSLRCPWAVLSWAQLLAGGTQNIPHFPWTL